MFLSKNDIRPILSQKLPNIWACLNRKISFKKLLNIAQSGHTVWRNWLTDCFLQLSVWGLGHHQCEGHFFCQSRCALLWKKWKRCPTLNSMSWTRQWFLIQVLKLTICSFLKMWAKPELFLFIFVFSQYKDEYSTKFDYKSVDGVLGIRTQD